MVHSVMKETAASAIEINEEIKACEKAKAKYPAGSPQYLLFEREIAALKSRLASVDTQGKI